MDKNGVQKHFNFISKAWLHVLYENKNYANTVY